jgi:hypothetical protein
MRSSVEGQRKSESENERQDEDEVRCVDTNPSWRVRGVVAAHSGGNLQKAQRGAESASPKDRHPLNN